MLGRSAGSAISVVIPSARGFPAELIALLDAQLEAGDEIFLVRNLPPGAGRWVGVDGTRAETCGRASHLGEDRCTLLRSAPGAAAARNAGWRKSSNRWVLFIDDDVTLSAGFIQAVREAGRVGGTTVITFRVVAHASAMKPLIERTVSLDRGSGIRSTSGRSIGLSDAWQYGVGAAMMVRRDILTDTGGFKDHFGAGRRNGGAEDLEFLWHASRHTSVLYRGDISVVHSDVSTLRDVGRKLTQYGRAIGSVSSSCEIPEGFRMAWEYCGHLWRAALSTRRPDLQSVSRQLLFDLQIAFAFLETLRVFAVSRLGGARRDALCAQCRRHE
jgi:glycosyl transferase family 2